MIQITNQNKKIKKSAGITAGLKEKINSIINDTSHSQDYGDDNDGSIIYS